jgi:hypothetical protein
MKKYYSIPLLLLASVVARSQNFEKDMELMYKNFVNASKISYSIKYVLKESHDINSRVISQNTGRYVKAGETYLSQYDTKYTVVTPKQIILVDNSEKQVRVKKDERKNKQVPDFLADLKEYSKAISKVVKLETNKKEIITYHIELKDIPFYGISAYDISINTKKNYMEQMTLFYKKPLSKDPDNNIKGTEVPRLEIIFYDFNAPKLYKNEELDPLYYYVAENKKIRASSNFKSYNIKEIL